MSFTAIFGGTFNPLHIGHYEILSALEKDDEIAEIFLMPDNIPPHKVCDFLADDNTRISMCQLAANDFSKAVICLVEFERDGKSYSYDTVTELKEKYPDKNFAFVCGGDMLVSFDKWYRYEELGKLVTIIAFRRSDTDNTLFDSKVKEFRKKGFNIKVMEKTITSVSSSEIRSDFKKAKELLPERIYEFLNERGVYSGK